MSLGEIYILSLAMDQASDSYHLIELRDPYFLLEDDLTTALAAEGREGSSEEMSGEFSKRLISPKSVSRLLIERGEYSAVCFRYPVEVIADWSDWVCFEVRNEKFEEALCSAGIKLALFISSFCEIHKDDVCLRHVVRKWSPETHTFVCSWGEFTTTLEDVFHIMRIPIFGEGNPFSMELDEAQAKRLKTLKKGAYSFKEAFRFCNWVRHFWGSDKGGTFQRGEGFKSGCRVEAMLAYWLSKFIFTDFPHEQVQERVFPLAIKLAARTCFPLALLFLSHLYQKLDQIARDDRDGAGQHDIDTLVSTFFLQVFVWERFKGLAVEPTKPESLCEPDEGRKVFNLMAFPLCFRWFGKKAKKGAFRPAVMDKIEQFNFRPYLVDHGFLIFLFFHAERGSSPFIGPTELLLTTVAQSIVACDNLFGPSREKYSPHRVKRQFGIDQDVPSHLSFGGHIGDCIASFTQIVVTSGGDKLSGSLGKKGSAGSATLAFLGFWKQQRHASMALSVWWVTSRVSKEEGTVVLQRARPGLSENGGKGKNRKSNSTATPIEGSDSHSTAVSMEDCEHGDSGDEPVLLKAGESVCGNNNLVNIALARFRDFVSCFDAKDSLGITVDSIEKPPLSGNKSLFEGGLVPSEFVVLLTKFAQKYGGGSFSSLFAEEKSAYQKHTLIERLGLLLYSMEVEEVKHEGTFLVWRDLCHDVVDWGLKVGFLFDHLKQAARSFFGYKLMPAGSDNYCS
ncbi:hypothetical protein ACLB2K_013191 [Fragaria x ananassa]